MQYASMHLQKPASPTEGAGNNSTCSTETRHKARNRGHEMKNWEGER